MVFVMDYDGVLHCVNEETGEAFWTHEIGDQNWSSAMVADGKVYVGTSRRFLWIFAASPEKKIIREMFMDGKIASTVTVANGVVYIATMENLYALAGS